MKYSVFAVGDLVRVGRVARLVEEGDPIFRCIGVKGGLEGEDAAFAAEVDRHLVESVDL